jgi:Ca2+-transporting ATPase
MDTRISEYSIAEVFQFFGTSEKGLDGEAVRVKQQEFGLNVIEAKRISLGRIFLQQYANVLMVLLIIGALASMMLGEWIDGLVIIGVLVVNGVLGTIQEYKAEKLAELLSRHIPQTVMVRRAGKEQRVHRTEIVPGDLVVLSNGQIVPADGRVVKNFGVLIDESALTGE